MTKIEEALNEKIAWLEENQEADDEEFKTQKKRFEEIVQNSKIIFSYFMSFWKDIFDERMRNLFFDE